MAEGESNSRAMARSLSVGSVLLAADLASAVARDEVGGVEAAGYEMFWDAPVLHAQLWRYVVSGEWAWDRE